MADLTAIHNDNPDPAHGVRYRLAAVAAGDVVCGITDAGGAGHMRELLAGAAKRGAASYLVSTGPMQHETGGPPAVLKLDAADVWQLSTVAQPVAHMVCRLSGQRLRDATRDHPASSLPELLAADLAPRRVHHAPAAVA